MDYSNFVRNLYRYATSELKKHKDYYGKIVNLNEPLNVPSDFLHREESDSLFLPQQTVNIDAPTNYFIDFMDYYVKLMPDLGVVFASKERTLELYNFIVENQINEDDEKVMRYIELVVGTGIKTLENMGVL